MAQESLDGVELLMASAPSEGAARRAAKRLVSADDVSALLGGFANAEARALSEIAQERGVLFFNVGATSDALRRSGNSNTFHIEASRSAYVEAIAAGLQAQGAERLFLVHGAEAAPDAGDVAKAIARAPGHSQVVGSTSLPE